MAGVDRWTGPAGISLLCIVFNSDFDGHVFEVSSSASPNYPFEDSRQVVLRVVRDRCGPGPRSFSRVPLSAAGNPIPWWAADPCKNTQHPDNQRVLLIVHVRMDEVV